MTLIICESLREIGEMACVTSAWSSRGQTLNFVEQTKHVAVLVVLPYSKSKLNAFSKFLRCEKVSKREKNL